MRAGSVNGVFSVPPPQLSEPTGYGGGGRGPSLITSFKSCNEEPDGRLGCSQGKEAQREDGHVRVLWVAAGDDGPFLSIESRVADLERHVPHQVGPLRLDEIQYGVRLFRGCEIGHDGPQVPEREEAEIHVGGLQVSDQVATFVGHPLHEPRRNLVRVDVKLVYGIVRVLLRLVPVDLVELLHVDPVVLPDVKG